MEIKKLMIAAHFSFSRDISSLLGVLFYSSRLLSLKNRRICKGSQGENLGTEEIRGEYFRLKFFHKSNFSKWQFYRKTHFRL
jgi:hypothetical protein